MCRVRGDNRAWTLWWDRVLKRGKGVSTSGASMGEGCGELFYEVEVVGCHR